MKHLYDEILRRFPEVSRYVHDGDEDLPYIYIGYIVRWLLTVSTPAIEPSIIQRVLEFDRWCMSQPRGKSAADDIATIATVTLREKLFEYDELLPVVRRIISRKQLLDAREYLVAHVGEDRFEAALRTYDAPGSARLRRRG